MQIREDNNGGKVRGSLGGYGRHCATYSAKVSLIMDAEICVSEVIMLLLNDAYQKPDAQCTLQYLANTMMMLQHNAAYNNLFTLINVSTDSTGDFCVV
jgi:hypothetical protein